MRNNSTTRISRKIPKAKDFAKDILLQMLQYGDKGCDTIQVSCTDEKITISFTDVTSKTKLEIITKCIIQAIKEWKTLINATERLARITSCCITNTFEYVE